MSYYQEHAEARRRYQRGWREKNREKNRLQKKHYRETHKGEAAAYMRAYRKKRNVLSPSQEVRGKNLQEMAEAYHSQPEC